MSVRLPLLLLATIALLVSACDGDSDDERRTGIELVDTVIESVEAGDIAGTVSLMEPSETACTDPSPGELLPEVSYILCDEGVADGTPVASFLSVACEGASMAEASAGEANLRSILESADESVYAVYAPKDEWSDSERLGRVRHAVMLTEEFEGQPRGVALLLSDTGIIGTDTDCGFPPDQMARGYGEPILPPLGTSDQQPATSD